MTDPVTEEYRQNELNREWLKNNDLASSGPGGALGIWSPDAPPPSPNAADEEWATMAPADGVPAGWTAYDPTEGSLEVSIVGPGLQLLRTDGAPYGSDFSQGSEAPAGGAPNLISNTTPLDNTTYDLSNFVFEWPNYINIDLSFGGGDLSGCSIAVHGTTLTGDPNIETLTGWDGDASQQTDTIWRDITSIVVSGIVTPTGVIQVTMTTQGGEAAVARSVSGIYKAIPVGDFTAITKLCSSKDTNQDTNSVCGFALFEDATDFTKRIAMFGHHWFGDAVYAQYQSAYFLDGFQEGEDVFSQYLRLRRNGTGYFLDASVGGLAFTDGAAQSAGSPPTVSPVDIGFVPAHVGLIIDHQFHAVFEFLRFKDEDVGLYGVFEGARV